MAFADPGHAAWSRPVFSSVTAACRAETGGIAYFGRMKFNILWKGSCQLGWAMGMWLMAFPLGSWAQTATVTGTVVDAESRYPLLGATVQVLTSPEHVTTADLDGRFELVDVPLGRHALKVSFIGYEPRV